MNWFSRKHVTNNVAKHFRLLGAFGALCLLCLCSSCSEDDATVDEYADWQQRNEAFVASLSDSLARGGTAWMRLKNYSFDQATEGAVADYVYVKKLVSGTDAETSPLFTDSVRVSYQGRLIPSASYPEGYVFDTTVYGDFDMKTASTAKLLTSATVAGFATALQHMHRGDRWRVYIPYQLGYGSGVQSGIPAYSTLVFELVLVDFSPAGQAMPTWMSRKVEGVKNDD